MNLNLNQSQQNINEIYFVPDLFHKKQIPSEFCRGKSRIVVRVLTDVFFHTHVEDYLPCLKRSVKKGDYTKCNGWTECQNNFEFGNFELNMEKEIFE